MSTHRSLFVWHRGTKISVTFPLCPPDSGLIDFTPLLPFFTGRLSFFCPARDICFLLPFVVRDIYSLLLFLFIMGHICCLLFHSLSLSIMGHVCCLLFSLSIMGHTFCYLLLSLSWTYLLLTLVSACSSWDMFCCLLISLSIVVHVCCLFFSVMDIFVTYSCLCSSWDIYVAYSFLCLLWGMFVAYLFLCH